MKEEFLQNQKKNVLGFETDTKILVSSKNYSKNVILFRTLFYKNVILFRTELFPLEWFTHTALNLFK